MGVWCVAICLGSNTPQISISGVAAFYLATLIQIFLWGREALERIARVFLAYVSNFIDVLRARGKMESRLLKLNPLARLRVREAVAKPQAAVSLF